MQTLLESRLFIRISFTIHYANRVSENNNHCFCFQIIQFFYRDSSEEPSWRGIVNVKNPRSGSILKNDWNLALSLDVYKKATNKKLGEKGKGIPSGKKIWVRQNYAIRCAKFQSRAHTLPSFRMLEIRLETRPRENSVFMVLARSYTLCLSLSLTYTHTNTWKMCTEHFVVIKSR